MHIIYHSFHEKKQGTM